MTSCLGFTRTWSRLKVFTKASRTPLLSGLRTGVKQDHLSDEIATSTIARSGRGCASGTGLGIARKRVLRLMRENALLSPHRARPRPADDHDRKIITDAPNVMWAIDGTQVATVRNSKVWLFATVEHWNAEALGWHVSKRGTRREALQAMGMAVRQQFGHLGRDAARGVQLRHDHGSCFMAEDFQNQTRAWA